MQLVKKLDYKVSYGKLFHLIEDIRKSNPLVSKMNGLSLQHRKEVPNPWNIVDGLESLRLYNGVSEKDFPGLVTCTPYIEPLIFPIFTLSAISLLLISFRYFYL